MLLRTWGCIIKINAQSFLFAGPFEGLIFTCIITVKEWYLQITFIFKFLIKPTIVSARSDISFKNKIQIKLLLSSMMSSQCHSLAKVGVDWELISKKCLSPRIFECRTAFLLTACCLDFPRVQSSHGLNLPATWMPRALAVAQTMVSEGCLSSMWRLLIFFLGRAVADTALSLLVLRRKLTLVTQLSWIFIWRFRIIIHSIDHYVVAMVTWNPVSLWEFISKRK